MKNKDFIKKYRLDAVTKFPHDRFALDWGNDFMSRLEVWREFGIWNEDVFWRLYDEMRKKWEMLDLKCMIQLPESLWNYMRREIFIPALESEFTWIAEDKDFIDSANCHDLCRYIDEIIATKKIQTSTSWATASDAAFEWNHHYNEMAIGSLEYRPNEYWNILHRKIQKANTHTLWYAFDELTYQLKKKAAAKASVQFRIRKEEEERRKKRGGQSFDWWEFVLNGKFSFNVGININNYIPYFEILRVPHSEKVKEDDIIKSFRQLSMQHHPDKGGNRDRFEEIVEAKNKCIEYIKLSAKN